MSKSKLVCLNCGSEKLMEFREKLVTEYRVINKDNSLAKKSIEGYSDYNNAWGIECKECSSLFDYEMDDKNRVIKLIDRDK